MFYGHTAFMPRKFAKGSRNQSYSWWFGGLFFLLLVAMLIYKGGCKTSIWPVALISFLVGVYTTFDTSDQRILLW